MTGFARGISTNAGGAWRQLALPADLPNRYMEALAIDRADLAGKTVYVGFSGFSRKWTEGPGAGYGHLFVSADGGSTWSRLGGNLPYTTVMDLTLGPDGRLYAATHGRGIWSVSAPY